MPDADPREERLVASLSAALGDDFDIVRKLGRGSMASVYLAREKALGRLVAVKVLLPGRADDETARRRFEREARAAASLVHPNVVQVFRFGRLDDETPYLVMRFVKGRTMEERLKAEGRLPVDVARQVLYQVTSALAAAHQNNIVHRDVRPANVLWDEEQGSSHLTDFGIAALISSGAEEVTRLTKTGQMVGDPRYLSPEQLLDHDLTEQVDMYAVGVMGYELLTGAGPYSASTTMQWISAHVSEEPRDLRELRPEVDPAVADLLKRCLNKEPLHRPSAADAARLLSGEASTGEQPALSGGGGGDESGVNQLFRRRVPQIVVVAATVSAGTIGFVSDLVDRGRLDQVFFDLSLPLAGCGVAAAAVVAWFHGEKGRQEATVAEWVLLAGIAVVWLAVSGWIVVAS